METRRELTIECMLKFSNILVETMHAAHTNARQSVIKKSITI